MREWKLAGVELEKGERKILRESRGTRMINELA